jgi:hypothetical protein
MSRGLAVLVSIVVFVHSGLALCLSADIGAYAIGAFA